MNDQTPDRTSDELPEQLRVRREKLERLRTAGVEAYPVSVPRTHSLAEIRGKYPDLAPDAHTGEKVAVAGRVIFVRNTGKLCFATLREGGGAELQAMLSLDRVGAEALAAWKSDVDLGDQVFVTGEVVASRRGELSVLADTWEFTSKALRPLPVAHKPMGEETRVRERSADLVVRPDARRMVELRAGTIRSIREFMHQRGYLEVETPVLQVIHGGAAARPFGTHINAYDLDLYLRIAPELFLKRCLVGGIERVYELGRVFRNEGADSTHSPEFAMLEAYEAYGDYNTMATLSRELIQEAAVAAFGSTTVTQFDGAELELGGQWTSVSMYDVVSEALGEAVDPDTTVDQLVQHATRHDLAINPAWSHGKLVEELFEALARDRLEAPTFVRDFPVETTPLTRQHRSRPGVTEKWDLYINGVEIGTAYSELTDPVIQRERFVAQAAAAAAGDPEAMRPDEDFLRALEYGMPPAGGVGLGIDRILTVFSGRGIRETILFPLVRPQW